jgi:hypothetical protein
MSESYDPNRVDDVDVPANAIGLAQFLESHPPGSKAVIRDRVVSHHNRGPCFSAPELQLHCPDPKCGGTRSFASKSEYIALAYRPIGINYSCRNCEKSIKTFALVYVEGTDADNPSELHKIGEFPAFGPPLPARLISMVGPDRELFLRGRRAENIGLGVGAFAYYRRVVEAQWHRFVEQIIKVAEVTNASPQMIATLKKANAEIQFKKAVALVKDGIPEALKISGQNPMTLLYAALSEGIHDHEDAACLELAGSVRVVLAELAERVGLALKDERELQEAVARLSKANTAAKP